jgi:hypothetical protein
MSNPSRLIPSHPLTIVYNTAFFRAWISAPTWAVCRQDAIDEVILYCMGQEL